MFFIDELFLFCLFSFLCVDNYCAYTIYNNHLFSENNICFSLHCCNVLIRKKHLCHCLTPWIYWKFPQTQGFLFVLNLEFMLASAKTKLCYTLIDLLKSWIWAAGRMEVYYWVKRLVSTIDMASWRTNRKDLLGWKIVTWESI